MLKRRRLSPKRQPTKKDNSFRYFTHNTHRRRRMGKFGVRRRVGVLEARRPRLRELLGIGAACPAGGDTSPRSKRRRVGALQTLETLGGGLVWRVSKAVRRLPAAVSSFCAPLDRSRAPLDRSRAPPDRFRAPLDKSPAPLDKSRAPLDKS